VFQPVPHARWRAVVQSDLQQNDLNENHEDGLSEERETVIGPKPVEDSARGRSVVKGAKQCVGDIALENGCHQHDERNIKGEAIACLGAMYRDNLVGIGGYGRQYQAKSGVNKGLKAFGRLICLQQRSEVIDKE
jgi:hypothetical protein